MNDWVFLFVVVPLLIIADRIVPFLIFGIVSFVWKWAVILWENKPDDQGEVL